MKNKFNFLLLTIIQQKNPQIFITVYKTDTSLGILALFSTSHIQVHLKNAILVAVVA